MYNGTNYIGSEKLETSVANQEVVPLTPEGWTSERYKFIRFSLKVGADCTIIINNTNKIFVENGVIFSMDEFAPPITSIKFVESGIQYSFGAVY